MLCGAKEPSQIPLAQAFSDFARPMQNKQFPPWLTFLEWYVNYNLAVVRVFCGFSIGLPALWPKSTTGRPIFRNIEKIEERHLLQLELFTQLKCPRWAMLCALHQQFSAALM